MPATRQQMQRDPRFAIPPDLDGRIAFHYPNAEGRRITASLLDLSIAGLSFALDHELPLIVRGARIEGAVLLVADREIEGNVRIMYCSRDEAGPAIYGGIFYPATERDQLEMNGLLAALAQFN